MKKLLFISMFAMMVLAGCSYSPTDTNTNDGQNNPAFTQDEQYWIDRLASGDAFTEEEVNQIPDSVIDAVVPKIIKVVDENALIGGEVNVVREFYCYGSDCDQYITEDNKIGASVITGYRTTLASSMTSSQSTVPASSVTTKDGHVITMSDIGTEAYLSLEPGGNKEEIVRVTGISGTTWTGATRGLAFYGTATSTVSANRKSHNAGSVIIMSNVHYIFEQLVDKDSSETIEGVKTYVSYPVIQDDTSLCTSDGQLCSKLYIDTVGAGGFTSSNIGDGNTLRANGTAPETLDINTSTPDNISFTVDNGYFELATGTDSMMEVFWENQWLGTSTHPGLIMPTSTIAELDATTAIIDDLTVTSITGVNQLQKSFTAGENLTAGDAVMIGDGTDLILEDNLTDNDDTNLTFTNTTWGAQSFTSSADAVYINRASINISGGAPADGNVVVSIRATSGGEPTGADINSETKTLAASDIGPGLVDFSFDNPIPVDASTVYAIVVRRDNTADTVIWRYDLSGSGHGGNGMSSSDSGSSWSNLGGGASDLLFEIYEGQTAIGEIYQTDATSDTERGNNFIGFADETISADDAVVITLQGVDDNQSSLSPGFTYYMSNTPGAIATSAGSQSRLLCRALSATEVKIINDF